MFYEDNPTYEVGLHKWAVEDPTKPEAFTKIQQKLETYPFTASFLVVQSGYLVWEKYFNSKNTHAKNIHSVSKSLLSALVGMAVEKKLLSIDDYISDILPFYFKEDKKSITVKNLLTMSSGIKWKEDYTEYKIEKQSNWVQAILSLPQAGKPGFNYSTGDSHLLSAVLTHAVETDLLKYAESLLSPLGVKIAHWGQDPQSYRSGGYNFYISPREMARLGQFFLKQKDQKWVQDCWKPHKKVDSKFSYGYLWWLLTINKQAVYKMWGYGGQFIYILPHLDMVVVMTSDTAEEHAEIDGDALIKHIIPSRKCCLKRFFT